MHSGRGPSSENDQTQQYSGGSEQQRQAPERNAESIRQGPIVRRRPGAHQGEIRLSERDKQRLEMSRSRKFKAMTNNLY